MSLQVYLHLCAWTLGAHVWSSLQCFRNLLRHDVVNGVRRVQRIQPEVLVDRHPTALNKGIRLRSSAAGTRMLAMRMPQKKRVEEDRGKGELTSRKPHNTQ